MGGTIRDIFAKFISKPARKRSLLDPFETVKMTLMGRDVLNMDRVRKQTGIEGWYIQQTNGNYWSFLQ